MKSVNGIADLIIISASLAAYTVAAMFLDKLNNEDVKFGKVNRATPDGKAVVD